MKAIAKMSVYPDAEFGVKVSFMLNTEIDSTVNAICKTMNSVYPQITASCYKQNHNVIICGPCNDNFVNVITRFIEQIETAHTALERLLAIQKEINMDE